MKAKISVKTLAKKGVSLMLVALMLMTCWVFTPATFEATAAEDLSYNFRVTVWESNSFKSSDDTSYLRAWNKDGEIIYEKNLGNDPWESLGSKSKEFTVTATIDEYPAKVQVTSYKNSGVNSSSVGTEGRITFNAYVNEINLSDNDKKVNSGLLKGHGWITATLYTDPSLIPVDLSDVQIDQTVSDETQQKLLDTIKNALKGIKFGNDTIKGPYISFIGKNFYLFELKNSFSIDIDIFKLTLSVDYPSKTIKVLIGYGNGETVSGEGEWDETYNEVKDVYAESTDENADKTALYNSLSALADSMQVVPGSYVLAANYEIIGFMEFSFANETLEFSEGGLLVNVGVGYNIDVPFSGCPVFYAAIGLKADIHGAITAQYVTQLSFKFDVESDWRMDLGIGAGSKATNLYIEGGLTGNLNVDFNISTGDYYEEDPSSLEVGITGGVYVQGSLFGFISKRFSKDLFDVQLYPDLQASSLLKAPSFARAVMIVEEDEMTASDMYAEFTPLDRDYLETQEVAPRMFRAMAAPQVTTQDDTIYSETVYDYAAPVIAELPNGDLFMTWIGDTGEKSAINMTSLMYSVYDAETKTWSEAATIDETGTNNAAPVVSTDGDRIDILWLKSTEALADDTAVEALLPTMELFYVSYENGEFGDVMQITDNNLFEDNYQIATNGDDIAVTWSQNSANDAFGLGGTNTIYKSELEDKTRTEVEQVKNEETGEMEEVSTIIKYKEWSTPANVATTADQVSETLIYPLGNDFEVAYASFSSESETNDLQIGNVTIENASSLYYEDGNLYYLRDFSVYKTSASGNVAVATQLGISDVDNFQVYNGDIYSLCFTEFTTEIYVSEKLADGTYAPFKQVTNYDEFIRNYTVTTADNEIVYAMNLVDVEYVADPNAENQVEYGNSKLTVSKATEVIDLQLDAVYYDNDDISPNWSAELNLKLANLGNVDIDSVNIEISDKSGNTLITGTVFEKIAAGEIKTITTSYYLPEDISYTELVVEVYPGEATDEDLSNNTNEFVYGYADAQMTDLLLNERGDKTAYITGTVTNDGYTDMENVKINIAPTADLDFVIDTLEVGELKVGESYSINYELPEAYLSVDGNQSYHSLKFNVVSDTKEKVISNNEDIITFGDIANYQVFFIFENEVIDHVDAKDFASYDATMEGYTFNGWYTNDYFKEELKVESVDVSTLEDHLYLYGYYTEDVDFITISNAEDTEKEFQAGTTTQFTADQKVTWTVEGSTDPDTKITENGELTIGANETGTITVVATNVNDTSVSNKIEITIHEHTFGAWTTDTYATCTSKGLEERVCSGCRITETREIEKTAHNYDTEFTVDVEPTCHSVGSQSHHCKDCEATTDVEEIKMLDHTYGAWEVTTEATCTAEGEETRYCTADGCTAQETRSVAKLAHTYGAWEVTKEATCTAVGEETRYCTADGCTATETREIAMNEHADKDGDGKCDTCDKVLDPTVGCDCMCHNDSAFGQFLYKILVFFWNLFGINQVCECGVSHF